MNKVILLGRLTKDVDIKYTQGGTAVANFGLAVNRRFAKEGEQNADFLNIVAWGKTAEFCGNYFKKGQQVALVGRIQTRNYEDQQGQKRYVTEIVAEEAYFADSKKEEEKPVGTFGGNNTNTFTNNAEVLGGDDLPF